MGIICLYVLIQKSGQKTAKSHLCAMGNSVNGNGVCRYVRAGSISNFRLHFSKVEKGTK